MDVIIVLIYNLPEAQGVGPALQTLIRNVHSCILVGGGGGVMNIVNDAVNKSFKYSATSVSVQIHSYLKYYNYECIPMSYDFYLVRRHFHFNAKTKTIIG